MRPSGIIYKNRPWLPKSGEVRISLPYKVKVIYNYVYFWGTCFVVAAIAGIILSFAPIVKQEAKYQLEEKGVVEKPDYSLAIAKAAETSSIQNEALSYGLDSSFSLVIPKIDAKSKVIANVDTANSKEYLDALQNGVAHAKGTYFPGQGKPIFLFAHSTDSPIRVAQYNAVFYLLDKMQTGDQVVIYFSDKKYIYEISETKITTANDVSYLYDTSNEEKLYLMTCTPPGTTWKRLFVIAKPLDS